MRFLYKKNILLISLMIAQCVQSGQAFSQAITTEQNYAMNCPGVVMVQAIFSATVYVNKVEMNEKRFDKLVDSIKALDSTGTILSPTQKLDMVVKALYRSPLRYFSAGDEYFMQVHKVQAAGTGFLITGDGYIVTNCHVVDRDSAYIRNKFILSTYQEVTEKNINSLQSSWEMTLNEEQRSLLYSAYGLIFSQLSSMIIFDLKKEIYVLYQADSDSGTVTIRQSAKVIKKGKPMPGKDVAILKIDGQKDLPTLSFSKDTSVRIGAQALVFGYPEPATSNYFIAAESSVEPTLTAGIVSAIKKSIGGWPVIQMDALISHGSSGSPVCNDKGQVIGIATFGSLDQGGISLVSGFNFAIPVPIIQEYINYAGVHPQSSEASVLFNEGLDLFYSQFYRRALDKFEEVKKLNPSFFQINFYISECSNRIARGSDKHSPPRQYVLVIMIVIAVLTGMYLFFFRSRQKH